MSEWSMTGFGDMLRDGKRVEDDKLLGILNSHGPLLVALKRARGVIVNVCHLRPPRHLLSEIEDAIAAAEAKREKGSSRTRLEE